MNAHPDCGAAGCKILNPDGSFAPESKRSVPTIWAALTKLLGLHSIFPKSRLFGQYYLTWFSKPTGKGSCFIGFVYVLENRTFAAMGGFDERFFMYGEDIDLCYRVQPTIILIMFLLLPSFIIARESTKKGGFTLHSNFQ